MDIFALEVRIGSKDGGLGHPLSNHSHHGRDWDAQSTYARNAIHLLGICGDARELHGLPRSVKYPKE
jgi:hypothetical protein